MQRLVFRIAFVIGAVVGMTPPAGAQDPSTSSGQALPKLVRIVVPFSAGASNDAIARAIAPALSKRLGASVIVENRPGAASVIGNDAVAKSAPDGSVLLLTSSTFLTVAAATPKLPYDPIGSFAPVATVVQNPSLLAVSALAPFKTTAELIGAARAKPGEITYGTAGVGSITHFATELLSIAAKIRMTHVPYKGAANAAIDLAGGQIVVMISSSSTLSPFIRSGKVRVLAVTSPEPHPSFPGIPALSATVPGYSNQVWVGVFAPAGTAPALIERMNREITAIAASPELRNLFEPDGMVPVGTTPGAFAVRVKQELAQWKQIATSRKIVLE